MSTFQERAREIIAFHSKRDLTHDLSPQESGHQATAKASDATSLKLLVTIPEAAAILSVGQTTIKLLIKNCTLRSVNIYGCRRIPIEAV
jgi:hypothetical protein